MLTLPSGSGTTAVLCLVCTSNPRGSKNLVKLSRTKHLAPGLTWRRTSCRSMTSSDQEPPIDFGSTYRRQTHPSTPKHTHERHNTDVSHTHKPHTRLKMYKLTLSASGKEGESCVQFLAEYVVRSEPRQVMRSCGPPSASKNVLVLTL